jgi:hypothetical protein
VPAAAWSLAHDAAYLSFLRSEEAVAGGTGGRFTAFTAHGGDAVAGKRREQEGSTHRLERRDKARSPTLGSRVHHLDRRPSATVGHDLG